MGRSILLVMDIKDLEKMEDITFRDISFSDFVRKESNFLLRTEVEGIQVGLLHNKGPNRKYRVVVLRDGNELYSEYYPNNWKIAYEAYRSQMQYVRSMFVQSGRKPIFYYRDKYDNVVSVIYA